MLSSPSSAFIPPVSRVPMFTSANVRVRCLISECACVCYPSCCVLRSVLFYSVLFCSDSCLMPPSVPTPLSTASVPRRRLRCQRVCPRPGVLVSLRCPSDVPASCPARCLRSARVDVDVLGTRRGPSKCVNGHAYASPSRPFSCGPSSVVRSSKRVLTVHHDRKARPSGPGYRRRA
ncbi:hypothetical protein C8Q77DRAFT_255534 [Trametes polyzona]|nr:hypothetical protein C8Q77DRAFT_255534 [Trametes polyzona]